MEQNLRVSAEDRRSTPDLEVNAASNFALQSPRWSISHQLKFLPKYEVLFVLSATYKVNFIVNVDFLKEYFVILFNN